LAGSFAGMPHAPFSRTFRGGFYAGESMTENESGQDPQDSRLTSLEERLRRAEREEAVRTQQARKPVDANYQLGNRVLSYLIGGLAGGALIGWVIDRLLGTSPGFMIALLLLGGAAGFWNIIKLSSRRPD
jgi:ATP synthase protein I